MHVYEMWDPLKFQANPVQILCNNISILCVYALNLHSDIILKGLYLFILKAVVSGAYFVSFLEPILK